MAGAKFDIKDLDRRMRGVLDALKRELGGLRTGRASASLLEPVVVNVYVETLVERKCFRHRRCELLEMPAWAGTNKVDVSGIDFRVVRTPLNDPRLQLRR